MDIRQLRFFITVAEHLNFTEAARELYIAQPVVSQQIADLEKQIGTRLFTRTKRSVKLTPAGDFFLKEARQFVSKLDEVFAHTRKIGASAQGSLRIGFLGLIEKRLLPPVVHRYIQDNPGINVEVLQYDWNELHKELKLGTLDIVFLPDIGISNKADLNWKTLQVDYMGLAVSRNHPAAHKKSINLSDFKDENFLTFSPDVALASYNHAIQLCENRGFSPRFGRLVRSIETLFLLCESGVGVCLTTLRVTEMYPTFKLSILPIVGDDTAINIIIAWKKDNSNPCIPQFLNKMGTIDI